MEWDEDELEELAQELGPGGFHVVPHGDIEPHRECISCWCQPILAYRRDEPFCEIWAHQFAKDNPQ